MAGVDLTSLLNGISSQVQEAVQRIPEFDAGDVGLMLVGIGVGWWISKSIRQYVKRKGFRMILRDRQDKIAGILTRIINDGLFEAEGKGEISNQELNNLYSDLSKKLDLPDLIPKKRRAAIVKAQIKARRVKNKNSGVCPIPGPKPEPVKEKSKTVGSAKKFWKAA